MPALLLAGLLLQASPTDAPPPPADDAWTYRVPARDEPDRGPAPLALTLRPERPAELSSAVRPAGIEPRWAWLRYGDAESTRIGILVDQPTADDVRLYVDVNRDLRLDPEERVEPGPDCAFEVSLATSSSDADGRVVLEPRRVRLEPGLTGSVLNVATLGFLEATVAVGDRAVAARRRDLDANGLFGDAADRVWLDLDGDGAWSLLRERFPLRPILTLGERRMAVRSSRLGTELGLIELEGTGRIALRPELPPPPAGKPAPTVRRLTGLLIGDDGSATGAGLEPLELPVGRYRLGMVTLTLDDPGRRPWSFVFTSLREAERFRWIEVEADGDVAFDPVGELALDLFADSGEGGSLVLRPYLTTDHGLYLNLAHRRDGPPHFTGPQDGEARLEVLDAGGKVLGSANSGFA